MGKKKGARKPKFKPKQHEDQSESNDQSSLVDQSQEESTAQENTPSDPTPIEEEQVQSEKVSSEEKTEEKESDGEKPAILPKHVDYCPNCSLPVEYCEFNDEKVWEKCQGYLEEKFPELLKKISELRANDKNKKKKIHLKKTAKDASDLDERAEILLTLSKRGKKKFVTTIEGIDKHDIDAKELSKTCRKKLSCGASVNKEKDGTTSIEIQGDVKQEIYEILTGKFNIDKNILYFIGDKKKKEKKKLIDELYIE